MYYLIIISLLVVLLFLSCFQLLWQSSFSFWSSKLLLIKFNHWIQVTLKCLLFSFLRCIPRSFAKHISKDNFLTKIRIRRVFAEFVRTFQQHTVDKGRLGTHEIMYKYISTLEHLAPRFGVETFPVSHLELREDGDGSSSYSNTTHAQGASKDHFRAPTTHEIMVTGIKGIQWRKVSVQKVCQNTVSSFWWSNTVTCCAFCWCGTLYPFCLFT